MNSRYVRSTVPTSSALAFTGRQVGTDGDLARGARGSYSRAPQLVFRQVIPKVPRSSNATGTDGVIPNCTLPGRVNHAYPRWQAPATALSPDLSTQSKASQVSVLKRECMMATAGAAPVERAVQKCAVSPSNMRVSLAW
jgi:hypothetical protein